MGELLKDNKRDFFPTTAKIINNILSKEDYKNYLPSDKENAKIRKIESTTVISALPALTKSLDGELEKMGFSFTDSMVSNGFGPEGYNVRKIYTINPYCQILTTGECIFIDYVARYTNFLSRYVEAINISQMGHVAEAAPKLDKTIMWLHDLMQQNPEGIGVFVINGQYKNGNVSVMKVDFGGLINYDQSDLEEQNTGSVEDWPMNYPTSGCGTGETRTAYNLLFSLRDNHYNMIPMKNVDETTAKLAGILATASAFNSQPGATAFVGGHIYMGYIKKGGNLSPETGWVKIDGKKALKLRQFFPYLAHKLDYNEASDDFKKLYKAQVVDKKGLEDLINKTIDECTADYNYKIAYDNTKTLMRAGSYNKELMHGIIKNPKNTSINQEDSNEVKANVKKLYKKITKTVINKIKEAVSEISSKTLSLGDINTMFSQFDTTVEENNSFMAVFQGERRLDDDERAYYKKDAVPSAVVMRYLSDVELKNSKEHVFPVKTHDNSKIGFTSIAASSYQLSRQNELALFRIFLQQVSEYEDENLEGIMADAYEWPLKEFMNIELAKIDSRYATNGFETIGFKAGDCIDIIKVNPLGVYEKKQVITSGEKDFAFFARKYLEELKNNENTKDYAFKHDYVLHTALITLYKSLLNKKREEFSQETPQRRITKTVKNELWDDIRKRTRLYNYAKECEILNSKVSREKVDEIIKQLKNDY